MIEGKGTYGIVYSSPRFPYLEMYNFEKIKLLNNETIDDVTNLNEVSKIFYNEEDYIYERDRYIELNLYNLPDIYFNKPIFYGEISVHELYKVDNYKFSNSLKKYIRDFPYQITFMKGELVNSQDLNINIFYKKINNLFQLIKYLNDYLFLIDDFKLNNIIHINSIYKLIDYSSLINVSTITEDIFESSFLVYFSYYTYLNVLNISLINIISEKNEITEYYNKKSYNKEEYKYNKKYIINILYSILYAFKNNIFTITLKDVIFNKNIEINVVKFLYEIKDYKYDNKKIALYYEEFIKYLNDKYKDNKEKKIEDITKRINCYNLGILLLNSLSYIDSFLNFKLSNNVVQSKILKLAMYLCLNFITFEDQIYIFEPNIDNIILEYVS